MRRRAGICPRSPDLHVLTVEHRMPPAGHPVLPHGGAGSGRRLALPRAQRPGWAVPLSGRRALRLRAWVVGLVRQAIGRSGLAPRHTDLPVRHQLPALPGVPDRSTELGPPVTVPLQPVELPEADGALRALRRHGSRPIVVRRGGRKADHLPGLGRPGDSALRHRGLLQGGRRCRRGLRGKPGLLSPLHDPGAVPLPGRRGPGARRRQPPDAAHRLGPARHTARSAFVQSGGDHDSPERDDGCHVDVRGAARPVDTAAFWLEWPKRQLRLGRLVRFERTCLSAARPIFSSALPRWHSYVLLRVASGIGSRPHP